MTCRATQIGEDIFLTIEKALGKDKDVITKNEDVKGR